MELLIFFCIWIIGSIILAIIFRFIPKEPQDVNNYSIVSAFWPCIIILAPIVLLGMLVTWIIRTGER